METIIGREGTQKMQITDLTVSRKHCKVTANADGTFTVENLSHSSSTYVDGVEVIRGTANADSIIQLGASFKAKLSDLIDVVPASSSNQNESKASSANVTDKSFDIQHLKAVWDNYNDTNIRMADAQRRINLTRAAFGIFTMCAMPTIFFLGPIGYGLTGIGVLGNIYSFAGMKNAETAKERQKRQEEFEDAWVCPNPDCGRSLIARNYRMLVRNYQSCPYCKCKYLEKE